MPLSVSAARRGTLAAALTLGALLAAAPSAGAVNVDDLVPYSTEAEDVAYAYTHDNDPYTVPKYAPCPIVNVVVARGSEEEQGQSPGLDGWYWNSALSTYMSGHKSSVGVWHRIARELHDPSDGSSTATFDSADDVLRTDLTYAASLDFLASVPSGTVRLMNYLTKVTNRCDGSTPSKRKPKFVLLGFSQGALVVGNAVVPPTKRISWPSGSQAITPAVHNRIVAIGFVANPGFNKSFPSTVNVGNFDPAFHGVSPRARNAYPVKTATPGLAGEFIDPALKKNVQDKVRDYCVAKDWACQNSNPNNEFSVHANTSYHLHSKQSLAEWSVTQIRNSAWVDLPA